MIWILIAQLASVVSLTLMMGLNSRILGEYGVAQISLGLTYVLLINQLIFNGINASINRYYHVQDNSPMEFFPIVFEVIVKTIVSKFIYIVFGFVFFLALLEISAAILIASLIYGFIQGIMALSLTYINAGKNRKFYAGVIASDSAMKFVLGVLFIHNFGLGVAGFFMALMLSNLIIIFYLKMKLGISIFEIKWRVEKSPAVIEQLKYANPYAITGIFSWIYLSSDKWIISKIGGMTDLGSYVYLYQFGFSPPSMLMAALLVYLSPKIYGAAKNFDEGTNENADSLIFRCNKYFVFFGLFVAFILYFSQSEIMKVLLGKSMAASLNLYIFFAAGVIFSTQQLFSMLLNARFLTEIQIFPKAFIAIFGSVSHVIFIKYFGVYNGIVASFIFSSLIFNCWIYFIYKKNINA